MSLNPKIKTWLARWGGFWMLLSLLFSLFFFGKQQVPEQSSPSSEPVIETKTLSDFSRQLTLQKPGKIVSSQDILVSAQANGKVSRVLAREGSLVKGGQPIVQLSDTIASYKLQVERAKNWLDRALLMQDQTEISLNQQIQQAENTYKTAQQAFTTAQATSENTLKQAGLGLSGAESQFEALKKSFLSQKTALSNLMLSVLNASDALLGMTAYYKDQLSGQEVYVGAKDQLQKNQAQADFKKLYVLKEEIQKLPDSPWDGSGLNQATQTLNLAYEATIAFVGLMEEVMKNSISSEGTFGEAELNKQLQLFQNFQSWIGTQQARASFIAYLNQVDSQLHWNTTLAQENAELTYQNTLSTTQNSLFSAEITLKNAKINYETLLANKEVQLNLLSNALTDAKISYESALIQYNKLEVRTPVSGVIGEILVSEGQEIAMGMPIFKVSGTKKQQIEVFLTADEYQYIQEKIPVQLDYQNQLLTWQIEAMSTVADRMNLFKATIQLTSEVPLLGDVAKVYFPIQVRENTLLPLEKVKILNINEGAIPILTGGKVEDFPLKIKRVRGAFVEVEAPLSGDLRLVL